MRIQYGIVHPVMHCLDYANQKNAVKESDMDEKKKRSQAVRHCIEKDGIAREKMALYTSGLYPGLIVSPANNFEISDPNQAYRRSDLGYIYLIPDTLTSRISLDPPFYLNLPSWLQFLFRGDQIRYVFFQQEATETLLRKERTSNTFRSWCITTTVPTATLAKHSEWTTFTLFFEELVSEKQRLESMMKQLSPFFHWINYGILQGYQTWLKTTAQKALHQQIQQFSNYLKRLKNQSYPFDPVEVETLLCQLESHHCQWHADLFSELAAARLLATELIPLPSRTTTSSESSSIFDKLYAEFYKVIHAFEANKNMLSSAEQASLQNLKTILKQSESERDARKLREKIANYRTEKMKNDPRSLLGRLWGSESLVEKLDTFLYQYYDENLMDAHQRAQMKEMLEDFTERSLYKEKDLLSQETLQELIAPFVQLGKQILHKTTIDLENDMASLASHKSRPVNFTHQTFAYLYGFLSSLMELRSKNEFSEKLAMFQKIVLALDELTQGTACNITSFLGTLKIMGKKPEITCDSSQWKFLFTSFFKANYQALHKTYGSKNLEEKSPNSFVLPPSNRNNDPTSNFSFSH
jgi:hypothetical protein